MPCWFIEGEGEASNLTRMSSNIFGLKCTELQPSYCSQCNAFETPYYIGAAFPCASSITLHLWTQKNTFQGKGGKQLVIFKGEGRERERERESWGRKYLTILLQLQKNSYVAKYDIITENRSYGIMALLSKWLRYLPKDQAVVSSIPTRTKLSGVISDLANKTSLCINHSKSLCNRDYPPDLRDQQLG